MFENIIEDLKQSENGPVLICLILVTIGLFLNLEYWFYILLRIAFFGILIWLTLRGPGFNKLFLTSLPGLFLILSLLLYNPIFLIHLGSKFVWFLLNIATVLIMLWLAKHKRTVD